MLKRQVNINVTAELDPMPGTMHDEQDAQRVVQWALDSTIGYYRPKVTISDAQTLRQQRDALAEAATKFLESIEWDEDGATFHPDPGCIKCTEGVTPNHLKTGLCGYHALKSALNSMEADNG